MQLAAQPVLVDTSVWVNHFKTSDERLIEILEHDAVLTHPFVIGEILCGTPPSRHQIIPHLLNLKQARQASLSEVIRFVEQHKAYGCGCGFVDISLLVSALMTPGASLWTLDKRLTHLAETFGVAHHPVVH